MQTLKALVTGASSGIGKAMAMSLAQQGHELFLVARRSDKLQQLELTLKENFPNTVTHLIAKDISDPALPQVLSQLSGQRIDILINSAGLALGREKFENSQATDWEEMIHTNVLGNFRLVHLVLPWMLKHGQGDVINLCSIAGHYTYSGGAIYCATKHAVLAFTRAVREETCGKNIRVMQISPGMVDTEFSTVRFKGDKEKASSVYAGMTPLRAEDIARMMTFMLEQPRHVVIDELVTMPMDQGSATTVCRSSP
ncbi:MAG TPA: SDR family NAD(P)-dependent oxidoreductase [Bacteriovoracaceae bacterium]|nr:SDR family NAD(P)-dependent oxidoreductase [Bacteriovoracaceae bacterium]